MRTWSGKGFFVAASATTDTTVIHCEGESTATAPEATTDDAMFVGDIFEAAEMEQADRQVHPQTRDATTKHFHSPTGTAPGMECRASCVPIRILF